MGRGIFMGMSMITSTRIMVIMGTIHVAANMPIAIMDILRRTSVERTCVMDMGMRGMGTMGMITVTTGIDEVYSAVRRY